MAFTARVMDRVVGVVDTCPWGTLAARNASPMEVGFRRQPQGLYTVEERRRRDASPWTMVQAVLAPVQFFVFLVSVCLVMRYLMTGEGLAAVTVSVLVKTGVLYAIMITGSIWERAVFGRYLFAPAFFWEDVVSILVLALHTLYLATLIIGTVEPQRQIVVVLAAYAAYLINAAQYVLKFRLARVEHRGWNGSSSGMLGA